MQSEFNGGGVKNAPTLVLVFDHRRGTSSARLSN
jgi:hypothetical protein